MFIYMYFGVLTMLWFVKFFFTGKSTLMLRNVVIIIIILSISSQRKHPDQHNYRLYIHIYIYS